ncbi:MAG: response regulator [Candidatus Woesearchaeota archaeon]
MKSILYVEDNADTAEAVKIILSSAGFDVTLANCGKEGLRLAQEKKFDLFLLDIMLPDMSGWDIFEKLKPKINAKYAFISAIPVSAERIAELKKSGVSDYIMKPFTKADLVKRVTKILA